MINTLKSNRKPELEDIILKNDETSNIKDRLFDTDLSFMTITEE